MLGYAAPGGVAVGKTTIKYLEAHQDGAAYLVAAVGSSTAGPIALQSDRNVIDMGGFMGSDPAPSLAKLESFIASGQLHYVLLSSMRQGGGPGGAGGGARGGPGRSTSAASSAAVSARDAWIVSHGTVVHVPEESSSAGGLTLYYFARSK